MLADPRLSIYACGRNDIQTGQIDQRILAAMEYLADNGFRLTITSLKCGHSFLTTSGNVSEHSTGDAMDIAAVNGIPIVGNQGPGTITEAVIKTLLQLQGTMQPHQIISLDEPRRAVVRDGGPLRPHPRRLLPEGRQAPGGEQAVRLAPEAGPVAEADRADRRDPEPEGPHLAVAVLAPGRATASTQVQAVQRALTRGD